jgi:hypothetical protein
VLAIDGDITRRRCSGCWHQKRIRAQAAHPVGAGAHPS